MNIGNLIRAERKAKGKTLVEIGDALAISDKSVWELEKLNRGTMAGLERICQFLGVEWIGLAPQDLYRQGGASRYRAICLRQYPIGRSLAVKP